MVYTYIYFMEIDLENLSKQQLLALIKKQSKTISKHDHKRRYYAIYQHQIPNGGQPPYGELLR